jgi:trafficking protein particle complex subunit 3
MGQRLIDEFLARTKTTRCSEYREIAERIAKVGFRMFLNVGAAVAAWSADGTECSIVLEDNPLAEFVELPESLASLKYSNVLAGAIQGALEAVNVDAKCELVKDSASGDDTTELRLKFIAAKPEQYPFKDDD